MVYETQYVSTLSLPEWWVLHQLYSERYHHGIQLKEVARAWAMTPRSARYLLNRLVTKNLIGSTRSSEKIYHVSPNEDEYRLAQTVDEEMSRRIFEPSDWLSQQPIPIECELQPPIDDPCPLTLDRLGPDGWWIVAQLYRWNGNYITSPEVCWTWHKPASTVRRTVKALERGGLIKQVRVQGYGTPNLLVPIRDRRTCSIVKEIDAALYRRFNEDYSELDAIALNAKLEEVLYG